MSQVVYTYHSTNTTIQCQHDEQLKNINERFKQKLKLKNNSLYYIYNGTKVIEELTFDEISDGKETIHIIVNEVEDISQKQYIESKDIIFPEWEGFLFLLFLEDYYGKESLLHFFSMLYENKIAWIDALLDAFKSDFETIQKNSLNFARSFMSSRYRGLWTAYKKVLKQYIDKKYRNAIPEFKKLTIQFSGNFIESNITL